MKQEGELAKQEASQSTAPKLDLGFKEGQTIKISLGVREGERETDIEPDRERDWGDKQRARQHDINPHLNVKKKIKY